MRLRIGLRNSLILFSLFCALFGVLGRWWLEDRRQQTLVDQCEQMLASEGQVALFRDGQQYAYFVFDGPLSAASARALCNADYVRCITINGRTDGAVPAETAAVLREVYAQPDLPGIARGMWARPGNAGFVQDAEDRGRKAPSEPALHGKP
jgi:hypothetical protein